MLWSTLTTLIKLKIIVMTCQSNVSLHAAVYPVSCKIWKTYLDQHLSDTIRVHPRHYRDFKSIQKI